MFNLPFPFRKSAPHGLPLLTRLAGRFRLRGLEQSDADAVKAHFLRLSPEARGSRFHGCLSDEAICAYVDRIDWSQTYAFGVFVRGELRAMSELAAYPTDGAGEIALSVEPQLQGKGLGRTLILLAMLAARRVGMSSLHLIYQAENQSMRSLARNLGAKATRDGGSFDGVISVRERKD